MVIYVRILIESIQKLTKIINGVLKNNFITLLFYVEEISTAVSDTCLQYS